MPSFFRIPILLAAGLWLGWQLFVFDRQSAANRHERTPRIQSSGPPAETPEPPDPTPAEPPAEPPPISFSVTLLALGPEAESIFESVPLSALDAAVVLTNLAAFGNAPVGFLEPPLGEDGDTPQQLVLRGRLQGLDAVAGSALDADSVHPLTEGQKRMLPALEHVSGDIGSILEFNGLARYPDAAVAQQTRVGFTQIDFAPGPQFGPESVRLALLARAGEQVIPSFLLQAAARALGLEAHHIFVELDGRHIHLGNRLAIPIDERGWTELPWRSWASAVCVTAAESILPTDPEGLHLLRNVPGLFRALTADFVLIAAHDPAGEATSGGPSSPGELHAVALLALLEGQASRPQALADPGLPPRDQVNEAVPPSPAPASGTNAEPLSDPSSRRASAFVALYHLSVIASGLLGLLLLVRISHGAAGFWLTASMLAAATLLLLMHYAPHIAAPSPSLFSGMLLAGILRVVHGDLIQEDRKRTLATRKGVPTASCPARSKRRGNRKPPPFSSGNLDKQP